MTTPQPLADLSIAAFLAALSAKSPTPGGGAVAAVTAATAASLARMVLSYSKTRKDLAQHHAELITLDAHLESFTAELLALADEDARAYAHLNTLQKLPPTDALRIKEFPAAAQAAINAPLRVLKIAADLCAITNSLPARTNPHLRSDLAMSALLAATAARSACINVHINLPLIEDPAARTTLQTSTDSLTAQATTLANQTAQTCQ
jgi:formiminotetrahydrofolate cyclodeaminase